MKKVPSKAKQTINPGWRPRFLELALRAIIRVHHNYIIWNIDQPGIKSEKGFKKLNSGSGIELADEIAVCDSITQEIMSSNILLGHYRNNESHFYQLEREAHYVSKKSLRADILIKKKDGLKFKESVYIEAKRVTPSFGKLSEGAKPKYSSLFKTDIDKLFEEWNYYKKLLKKKGLTTVKPSDINKLFRPYILLWGVYEKDSKTLKHPDIIMKRINKHYENEIAWYPIKWETNLTVQKWCWVSLVELRFD